MGAMTSQITSLTIVYSDADQRKRQSSASLAFVWGIHRWPVNSPHKWSVTRKMFPFDYVLTIGTYFGCKCHDFLFFVNFISWLAHRFLSFLIQHISKFDPFHQSFCWPVSWRISNSNSKSKSLLYQQPPCMKYNRGHFDNVGYTTLHYSWSYYKHKTKQNSFIYRYTHACTCARLNIYTHLQTHIYTHTRIYIYMYTKDLVYVLHNDWYAIVIHFRICLWNRHIQVKRQFLSYK